MIVKMKKASLVILDSTREEALEKLRNLGVVHIEKENKSSETLNSLMEKKALFEKSLFALPKAKNEKKSASVRPDVAEAEKVAMEINGIVEKIHALEAEKEKDIRDISTLAPWGEFDPSFVSGLEKSGISLGFYIFTKEQFADFPENVKYITVSKIKNLVYILVIFLKGDSPVEITGEKVILPALGIKQLNESIKNKEDEIIKLKKDLEKLAEKKQVLVKGLKELKVDIEFESVNAEMNTEDQLSYISGYIPANLADTVKEAAAANNWAVLVRDPGEEDRTPTLVKNNKFVEFIKPLFAFLEVTPGYKELDISFFFLIFFIPFTAMIIGDAGYGILFLIITIIMRIKIKKFKGSAFGLFFILSLAIISWGTITGNFFGSKTISELPFIAALTIPEISSFGDSTKNIQKLVLFIGLVQLTLGILVNFVRKMPSLIAFANFGWLFILFGMYFAVQYFVLGAAMNPLTGILLIVGFVLLMLFSYQEKGKNVFKGALMGLAWSPLTALNCISIFGDIISYIRLFAVGLAGWAVASSFNVIIANVSNNNGIVGIFFGALIALAAHTFNIALSSLAVIVHGVRLNMLEFGSKVGMEWSGQPYSPFKKESA